MCLALFRVMCNVFHIRELIMKHGVCIRVLGDLQLLPGDVLEAIARAVNFTRNNDRAFLNVCFSYTSHHEMTEAIRRLARGTVDELIFPRYACNLFGIDMVSTFLININFKI